MFRAVALLCCFTVSGCSVWLVNKKSPTRLDGCHAWVPAVDVILAAGFGATAIAAEQNSFAPRTKEDKTAYMVGSIMLASVFAISALMGYGDYSKCEE